MTGVLVAALGGADLAGPRMAGAATVSRSLGGSTIEAMPPPVAVSIGTDAACITGMRRPGKRPKTITTRVAIAIGISIDLWAEPSRREPGSRRNMALSTRT